MGKIFTVKKKQLIYKNLYYFNLSRDNSLKTPSKYIIRTFYFFKLINFFKKNGYNKNLALKIFLNNYYHIWILFLQNYNFKYYYLLLKKIITKYNCIVAGNYNNLISSNNITTPTNFLNYNNILNTRVIDIDYSAVKKILIKSTIPTENKIEEINVNKFIKHDDKNFTIHFIRVQRRYNKRRYSKVRVSSRPSFFAGISLSSIMLAILWNGSLKSVDWLTAWIVVIDVNLILFLFFVYFLVRIYRSYRLNIFLTLRGKSKVVHYFNTLLTKVLVKYIFK